MNFKVTKNITDYPKGFEPTYINPKKYCDYRYVIDKEGVSPLVAICMNPYNNNLCRNNIQEVERFLIQNHITEVWGAWGDDKGIEALAKGRDKMKEMLCKNNISIFYFVVLNRNEC